MRRFLCGLAILTLVPLLAARADDSKPAKTASKDDKKKTQTKVIIPVFRLHGEISESPPDDTFPFGGATPISMKDLVERLQKDTDDSKVNAVVILPEEGGLGSAKTEELRQAMAEIRSAGKDD